MPIIDIEFNNFCFQLEVFDNETLSDQLIEKGYHGYNDFDILKNTIKSESTVIDLGANIGWYTIIFSHLVGPNGKVYAFEPDIDNIDMLEKNILLNNVNNVKTTNCAVIDYNGMIDFYRNPENYGDHSISELTYTRCFNIDEKYSTPIQVSCIRLDTFFTIEEFSSVSLIKMDIQGGEFRALTGLEKHLKYHRPTILLEYSPAHIYQAHSSPFELFVFIDKYRYYPFQIINDDPNPAKIQPISLRDLFEKTQQSHNDFGSWIDLLLVPESQLFIN